MKKYVCTVCGYIAEGEIPAQCPVCKAPASAFVEKTGNTYVTEHVVGIGKAEGVPQEIVDGLRANFEYLGYKMEPKQDPDADWRLDVMAGSTCCVPLINGYLNEIGRAHV